jgi:ferredoxin
VTIHIGHRPSRILRADDGVHVAALELMNDSATDAVVIPCQRIVTAARRVPRASFLAELRVDEYGYVAADSSSLRTSHPRVWAGGACAFGHRSFAHAIADGKRGAWSIHAALTATRLHVTVASAWVELDEPTQIRAETALRVRRVSLPILESAPDDPFASGESYLADAAREASRCFDCAVTPTVAETCTGCSACLTACPTGALKLAGDPARAVVEQELCTRCGACVPSCPEGAIALLRAVWETRLSLEPEPSTMLGLIESPPSTQRTHRGLGSRGVPLPLHAL